MDTDNQVMTLETKEIFQDDTRNDVYGGVSVFKYIAASGELVPPWWSEQRDLALRRFWKDSDHLSGTVNTLRDMLVAIPVKVVARDASNKSASADAERFTRMILEQSTSRSNNVSQGWGVMFGAVVEDYHTQDNGLFIAIEGPGAPDGPLTGEPTKLIHLDSNQCLRTNSEEYPVIYTDADGKRYKLHYTRVIALSSMSSPDKDMHGVGFCAVSRAINVVQNLIDISRYKQEKLGSRPMRGIMHIEGGGSREVKALDNLFEKYNVSLDNQGFTRYGKIPIFASSGAINLVDFASLPDGFDEMTSTQLAMSVLALAFGVDARQLAFAMGVTGQTKADALVQHLKMRGKGPGVFLEEFTRQAESKILPDHLQLIFDYQDDEQDRLTAEIRKMKAESREIDLRSGVTTVELEREFMLESGELTQEQFDALMIEQDQEDEAQQEQTTQLELPFDTDNGEAPDDESEQPVTKSQSAFTASIRASARALRNGDMDVIDFVNAVESAINRGYEQAWQEGAAKCGISPDERTAAESQALVGMIIQARLHVFDLGDWIESDLERPWSSVASRLELWSNRYQEVVNRAQVLACSDKKLEWVVGPTDHCSTCFYLDGRVMRASRWAELDIWPRDTRPGKLECGGFRCQCSLQETSKPATRGRLPNLGRQ